MDRLPLRSADELDVGERHTPPLVVDRCALYVKPAGQCPQRSGDPLEDAAVGEAAQPSIPAKGKLSIYGSEQHRMQSLAGVPAPVVGNRRRIHDRADFTMALHEPA